MRSIHVLVRHFLLRYGIAKYFECTIKITFYKIGLLHIKLSTYPIDPSLGIWEGKGVPQLCQKLLQTTFTLCAKLRLTTLNRSNVMV